jgi:hypothetical protein
LRARRRLIGIGTARDGAVGVLADGEAFDADAAGALVAADDFVVPCLERQFAGLAALRDLPIDVREHGARLGAEGADPGPVGAGFRGVVAMPEGVAVAARRTALRLDVAGRRTAAVDFLGKSPGG